MADLTEHITAQDELDSLADTAPVDILIVDDLPEKLIIYQSILEELGQNLITVRSGEEALKMVLQHEFAVILLDVNMPGMDGFETASLIRKRKKSAHTPIIFLTAFTDDVHAAQGYASGAVDYLPTPVVPEILKTKVKVFIELSQMRRKSALQAEERALRRAAEESARRSDFLVRVSEILPTSHSHTEIVQALVALPIPHLADVGMVWLADEPNRLDWAYEPEKRGEALDVKDLPWLKDAIDNVILSGHLSFINRMPAAFQPAELRYLQAALVLPLTVQGTARGVLILARNQQDAFPPNDIALASVLAERASIALENAMLFEQIQEADRRKDEFLGMLAHELRNPLGPIRNAVHLLKVIGAKEERSEELHNIIDRQVTHMSRLIDDLLDATRLARGQVLLRKERCDLSQIVRQTAEDYRTVFEGSGLHLEIDVSAEPVFVEGDMTRLVQMVGNLLHNAHKFTLTGGLVTVRLTQEKGAANIIVTDEGIGIDAKILPYVFDVFRQAEQGLDRTRGGLGLGLALVKGLVGLHDGQAIAHSDGPGKGASFTISLPITDMAAKKKKEVVEKPRSGREKYRILVIEDNRDTAESARMLLTLEGYDVKTAYNGSSGIETAKSFKPQVVLCDIGLPGMDGYQIARTIRNDPQLSGAYVIALTGYGRDEDQRQAREAGFDMHMTKPIDFSQLRHALGQIPARAS